MNVKKIGILTFHFADNYGAVLQSYALRKKINELPECKAEIINFIPGKYMYPQYSDRAYIKHKFKIKRKVFDEFLEKECGISEKCCSYIRGRDYDYYCAGSDQIWAANDFSQEYFFPHIDKKSKKISYAASLGLAKDNILLNKKVFSYYLPDFKCISIRESEHIELIKELSGQECKRVLDPTLLFDGEDYRRIISKRRLRKGEFLFFYWLNHNNPAPGVELVNILSRIYNIPVIHSIYDAPSFMFQQDGGCMYFESIQNFLWYIENSKFVVTNSYHGTIFSVLFKRPFYTFVVDSMRSRIDTLIEIMDIKERIVERYISADQISENIDFERIDESIKKERKKSIDFLKSALDINNKD